MPVLSGTPRKIEHRPVHAQPCCPLAWRTPGPPVWACLPSPWGERQGQRQVTPQRAQWGLQMAPNAGPTLPWGRPYETGGLGQAGCCPLGTLARKEDCHCQSPLPGGAPAHRAEGLHQSWAVLCAPRLTGHWGRGLRGQARGLSLGGVTYQGWSWGRGLRGWVARRGPRSGEQGSHLASIS